MCVCIRLQHVTRTTVLSARVLSVLVRSTACIQLAPFVLLIVSTQPGSGQTQEAAHTKGLRECCCISPVLVMYRWGVYVLYQPIWIHYGYVGGWGQLTFPVCDPPIGICVSFVMICRGIFII